MPDLGWRGCGFDVGAGDVLEEGLKVEILLVMRSDGRASLLTDDR